MSTTMTLSTRCGPVQPVGFSTQVSVTGFPPNQKLGIDLLDLDEKRLEVLASGTVTTDPNGALTALPVRINAPDGVYFVRVFVDDGTGNPAQGQPESQVQVAAPCDVLYALTSFNFPQGTSSLRYSVEIVDVTVRSAPHFIRLAELPLKHVESLDVSPDRRRFYVLGGDPATATLSLGAFDVATGSAIASLAVDINNQAVALSPDGQTLVLAAVSKLTSVAAATMTLRAQTFNEPAGHPINALVFSPDGTTLAATSLGVVHLLDPVALTVIKSIPVVSAGGPFFDRMAAVFTDTNRLLLWASNRSEIYQIDLATQAQIPSATISMKFQRVGSVTPLDQIVYSSRTQNAYALRIAADLATASPASATLVDLTDFVGSPEQLVMTPDGAQLYFSKQPTGATAPCTLDLFDTAADGITGRSIYEFKNQATTAAPMIIRSSPTA